MSTLDKWSRTYIIDLVISNIKESLCTLEVSAK